MDFLRLGCNISIVIRDLYALIDFFISYVLLYMSKFVLLRNLDVLEMALNDSQIKNELARLGIACGPINDSTRSVYLRKINQAMKKKRVIPAPSTPPTRRMPPPSRVPETPPSPEQTSFSSSYNQSYVAADSRKSPRARRQPSQEKPMPYSPKSNFDSSNDTFRSNYLRSSNEVMQRKKDYKPITERPAMSYSKPLPSRNRSQKTGTKSFEYAFIGGVLFTVFVILAYAIYPKQIREGVSNTYTSVQSALMTSFFYTLVPIVGVVLLVSIGFGAKYAYKHYSVNKKNYEDKKKAMIEDILKHVKHAHSEGFPVKQLRDTILPPYNRQPADLALWNECENLVKYHDTRIRTEERTLNGSDIVEHFIWAGVPS